MTTKKQPLPQAIPSANSQVPQPDSPAFDQSNLLLNYGKLVQRARINPHSLSTGEIHMLHHTVGNRAIARLFERKPPAHREQGSQRGQRGIIQRQQGDAENGLKEEEWGIVTAGKKIKYSPLAAGCLAVTVLFSDGGGAGVHLAMMPHNASQWNDFLQGINGRTVSKVFLDSDTLGDPQGWRVKYDIIMLESDITVAPRSSKDLSENGGMSLPDMNNAGWVMDKGIIKDWFKERLGAEVVTSTSQTPEHTTL